MNYLKILYNILAFVASQSMIVGFVPEKYQPVGIALVGLASALAALFQQSPNEKGVKE